MGQYFQRFALPALRTSFAHTSSAKLGQPVLAAQVTHLAVNIDASPRRPNEEPDIEQPSFPCDLKDTCVGLGGPFVQQSQGVTMPRTFLSGLASEA